MTQFAEEIQNSNVATHLRSCTELLTELESVRWNVPEQRDLVSRSRVVVEDVRRRLTTADLDLVPRDLLSILEPHTQSLLEFVQLLKDSGPEGNFNIIDGHQRVDSVLAHATSLPLMPSLDESVQKAAEQFARTAIQSKEDIEAAVNDARRQFEDLSKQIADKSDEFDSTSAGHKTSFDDRSATFESRVQGLTDRVNQATERIEREVTSIQETFRRSQTSRDEEFQHSQTIRGEDFHAALDDTVAEVESFRDQARSMLGEVAGASTAEHYAGHAKKQGRIADIWRWIGVVALVVMVAASGWVFFDSSQEGQEFSFAWLVARTGLLGSILIFATYVLRQSANHRRLAENMERLANELQLLWPFIDRLPDEHKEALMVEITPLYFTGQSGNKTNPDNKSLLQSLIDRLKARNAEGD